jgi:hypothetical protein
MTQFSCPVYGDIPVKRVPFVDITVFRDVMTCNLVDSHAYHRILGTFIYTEDGSSRFLLHVTAYHTTRRHIWDS